MVVGQPLCRRMTSFCRLKGRSDRLRRSVGCTVRPRRRQLGQDGGRPHAAVSTNSIAAEMLARSVRASIPGNSTSSIAEAPVIDNCPE